MMERLFRHVFINMFFFSHGGIVTFVYHCKIAWKIPTPPIGHLRLIVTDLFEEKAHAVFADS